MLAFFVFVAFFFTAEWKEKVLSATFVQRDKLVSAKVSPVIRDSWISAKISIDVRKTS